MNVGDMFEMWITDFEHNHQAPTSLKWHQHHFSTPRFLVRIEKCEH